MIGGDDRLASLVQVQPFKSKGRIKVDMIQVKERQHTGVSSGATQILADIRPLQM